MRNLLRSIPLLALLGAGAWTGTAQAQDAGFGLGGYYFGAAAAYTDASNADEESGIGSHIFGGADFFRIPALVRVGVEIGQMRTRRIEGSGQVSDTRLNNTGISAKATWTTLPRIDVHGRLGYEDGDTRGTVSALGLTVKPIPVLGVRTEYARHQGFNAYTLGIRLRFR